MFKLVGFFVKIILFSAMILVLGQLIHWKGKTVSDQVRTHLAQAQRSTAAKKARGIVVDLADDVTIGAAKAKSAAQETVLSITHSNSGVHGSTPSALDESLGQEIAPTERQKLRSLIQELNRSHRNP